MNRRPEKILCLLGALSVVAKSSALACATCYGASDSPLAQGMNWGIATLLGVIGAVLAGVVAFFVHVGLRSAKVNAGEPIQTAYSGRSNALSTSDFTRQTDQNP